MLSIKTTILHDAYLPQNQNHICQSRIPKFWQIAKKQVCALVPTRASIKLKKRMRVNSFHSSARGPCGITIFSGHLRKALSAHGVTPFETNLREPFSVPRTQTSILHYVPSGFANAAASNALVRILMSSTEDEKIVVILHGLHSRGERRFQKDTTCPDQGRHISLMLHKAEAIVVLSEAVANICQSWQALVGGKARLIRLDHPGLFSPAQSVSKRGFYAFIGGISRTKKEHTAWEITELIRLCEKRGIRIWQHWTNVQEAQLPSQSWRQTAGVLSDRAWASLISCAGVILCPYQTRIQSVSGLISEALSAGRFVLATSFDLASEMQVRAPNSVFIADDIHSWPDLILRSRMMKHSAMEPIPTWQCFATNIALELLAPRATICFSADNFVSGKTASVDYSANLHSGGRASR